MAFHAESRYRFGMAIEVERKFLVTADQWRLEAREVILLRQGYLSTDKDCAVRVRVTGNNAWITVKGAPVEGAALEFEYPVPPADAACMLDNLAKRPLIEKKRHLVPRDGFVWEVDEFLGANAGLILAEVELSSPDQKAPLPDWVGREVTGEARYYNASLVGNPYSQWK